jgi:hypothetical protein
MYDRSLTDKIDFKSPDRWGYKHHGVHQHLGEPEEGRIVLSVCFLDNIEKCRNHLQSRTLKKKIKAYCSSLPSAQLLFVVDKRKRCKSRQIYPHLVESKIRNPASQPASHNKFSSDASEGCKRRTLSLVRRSQLPTSPAPLMQQRACIYIASTRRPFLPPLWPAFP